METAAALAEVARILAADVAELTEGGNLSVVPPFALSQWAGVPTDAQILWDTGLPPRDSDERYTCIFADYVDGPDGAAHHIAGIEDRKIVVEPATGEVFMAARGLSLDEVNPAFRDRLPQLDRSVLMNSSLPAFVELCWRWYWLSPFLNRWEETEVDADWARFLEVNRGRPDADVDEVFAPFRLVLSTVVDAFAARDPSAVAPKESFWRARILGEHG